MLILFFNYKAHFCIIALRSRNLLGSLIASKMVTRTVLGIFDNGTANLRLRLKFIILIGILESNILSSLCWKWLCEKGQGLIVPRFCHRLNQFHFTHYKSFDKTFTAYTRMQYNFFIHIPALLYTNNWILILSSTTQAFYSNGILLCWTFFCVWYRLFY